MIRTNMLYMPSMTSEQYTSYLCGFQDVIYHLQKMGLNGLAISGLEVVYGTYRRCLEGKDYKPIQSFHNQSFLDLKIQDKQKKTVREYVVDINKNEANQAAITAQNRRG